MKSHFLILAKLCARVLRRGDRKAFERGVFAISACFFITLGGCAGRGVMPLESWVGNHDVLWRWDEAARLRVGDLGGERALGTTLYIEGDGLAYIDAATPSRDPTPRVPVGLTLALANRQGGRVMYMGRPCQWQGGQRRTACGDYRVWTERRFVPEILGSQVAVALREAGDTEPVRVVGFSGGAVIAQLVAVAFQEQGREVDLVTYGGNLMPERVNAHHRVPTPEGWVKMSDFADDLRRISSTHYVGQSDKVVPPALTREMAAIVGGEVVVVAGGHQDYAE